MLHFLQDYLARSAYLSIEINCLTFFFQCEIMLETNAYFEKRNNFIFSSLYLGPRLWCYILYKWIVAESCGIKDSSSGSANSWQTSTHFFLKFTSNPQITINQLICNSFTCTWFNPKSWTDYLDYVQILRYTGWCYPIYFQLMMI